jgi:hypothetical protein
MMALAVIVVAFSGCANKVLYGTWQLKETINSETGESQEPMFGNMMVFTINKDGTVTFIDDVFGTYEKDRNEFTFTYTADEGEEAQTVSGAWELLGTDLYIYDDSQPYTYHLVAVKTTDDETQQ